MRCAHATAFLPLLALSCGGTGPAPRAADPTPSPAPRAMVPRPPPRYPILDTLPEALLRQANRGRNPIGDDGYFSFPASVRRVWVDVGAHHLETTRDAWEADAEIGLIAVEPLAECWPVWPDDPRLVGIPAALYLERGEMDFHVNAMDVTSSLAPSLTGSIADEATRTVEVRKVPVLRLEDLLERVPPEIAIEYVKTDVQGVDLEVLQSAGELLRRAQRVRAEVTNAPIYADLDGEKGDAEHELVSYMRSLGFRFAGDEAVVEGRAWLDKIFLNEAQEPTPATR